MGVVRGLWVLRCLRRALPEVQVCPLGSQNPDVQDGEACAPFFEGLFLPPVFSF